jgi:hypothetical protein
MQRFWWGHKENDKRIHWMNWSKMGIPKSKGGMGFRDLTSFNKALLAKQFWRLWKTPNSLVAQLMRAKYHPDCSILKAPLSKKPSFAWRSIQSASGLIRDGLIWRIGNGEKVRIWQDKWIPRPSTFKIQSPPVILNSMATVGELIDKESKEWNKSLLENIFSEEESKLILALPISQTGQEDIQLWRGTSTGAFTVRSAYHFHKERDLIGQAGGSVQYNSEEVWKNIWGMRSPNAEKNFLWCACHDILPTREKLYMRKIIQDSACPICENDVETVLHALWLCPAARDVWGAGAVIFQKSTFQGPTFLHVLDYMIQRCTHEELLQFASIARRIWLH